MYHDLMKDDYITGIFDKKQEKPLASSLRD